MKQLLIDCSLFQVTPKQINESMEANGGRLIVEGVLQRAEVPNQNGRIYPRPILEREVQKYISREIAQNRALGELDHPESNIVNLKNVSHNIKRVWWQGNDVMGEVEILSTPAGNILKELLKAGVTIGISSRGMGSVEHSVRHNAVIVKDDFDLVCWDFVSNPSTHGAFMYEKMTESINESVKAVAPVSKLDRVNEIVGDILCELTCECSIPKRS